MILDNIFFKKSPQMMILKNNVVTVPFLTASLLGQLLSDMVRVVDCHAGVLGLNPGGPKIFSPWNYFTGGSGNSVAPELAAVAGSPRLWLMPGSQEIKGGKSVVTVPFLTASLLG